MAEYFNDSWESPADLPSADKENLPVFKKLTSPKPTKRRSTSSSSNPGSSSTEQGSYEHTLIKFMKESQENEEKFMQSFLKKLKKEMQG